MFAPPENIHRIILYIFLFKEINAIISVGYYVIISFRTLISYRTLIYNKIVLSTRVS